MTPKEVRKYFKTGWRMFKATGISATSLHNWDQWGYVPLNSQCKLEIFTNGALKLDYADYVKKTKKK